MARRGASRIPSGGRGSRPTVDPDYESGDTGFLDVVDALEKIDAGERYRTVAEDTPNVTPPDALKYR